jgi:uncharacterized protein (TIGR02118 family)
MLSGLFTIRVFVARKPSLSPTAFKDHWENTHIPLLKSLSGPIFPVSHTRHYLARDPLNPDHPAVVLVRKPEDFDYDGFAEVTFESEAAFQEFLKVMQLPEVAEDEERLTDRRKLKAIVTGETTVSKRD